MEHNRSKLTNTFFTVAGIFAFLMDLLSFHQFISAVTLNPNPTPNDWAAPLTFTMVFFFLAIGCIALTKMKGFMNYLLAFYGWGYVILSCAFLLFLGYKLSLFPPISSGMYIGFCLIIMLYLTIAFQIFLRIDKKSYFDPKVFGHSSLLIMGATIGYVLVIFYKYMRVRLEFSGWVLVGEIILVTLGVVAFILFFDYNPNKDPVEVNEET